MRSRATEVGLGEWEAEEQLHASAEGASDLFCGLHNVEEVSHEALIDMPFLTLTLLGGLLERQVFLSPLHLVEILLLYESVSQVQGRLSCAPLHGVLSVATPWLPNKLLFIRILLVVSTCLNVMLIGNEKTFQPIISTYILVDRPYHMRDGVCRWRTPST